MPRDPSQKSWVHAPTGEPLLTTVQAARLLGVQRTYVHVLIHRGYLPPPVVKTRFFLHKQKDIEQYKRVHPRVGLHVKRS